MIDSRTLHDFLTANVHPELYPRLFVISRKGKLVAYSTKHDISRIEDEAALVAKAWRDTVQKQEPAAPSSTQHSSRSQSHNNADAKSTPRDPALKALTIEAERYNILVKPIQLNLLLVLVGGIPPGASASRTFKITPETVSEAAYPGGPDELEREVVALTAGSKGTENAISALALQRRKIDLLAEAIMEEAKVLKIPDDV